MRFLVTGGAGFLGSHLVDRLLQDGHRVVAYDNLSIGHEKFLSGARESKRFSFVRADTLDQAALVASMGGSDFVFHLAANADVRYGTKHPRKDLEQNTIATLNVLDAMRASGISQMAFASTGSIYGEPVVIPTPESAPFPIQTSLYGASKLACEGLIQAYCEGFSFQAYIFRFVSVLGERYSHGHVFDFYKSLMENPLDLRVLGNGHQRKSYVYVQDCIDGMLQAIEKSDDQINIFNLGTDEYCEVDESIQWITAHLNLSPRVTYTGGDRGWIGDSPFIFLDCEKIKGLGWSARLSIKEGVIRTLEYLQANPWILDGRT